MKKTTLALLIAFMLFSCSTIPIPENEQDTLVVLVTELHKSTTEGIFGRYIFTITSADGNYTKKISVTRDKIFLMNNLEPGLYNATYEFQYIGGKKGSSGEAFFFEVKEGTAVIIDKKINVYISRENNHTTLMSRYFEPINDKNEIKNNLLEKYPELNAWEWEL